MKPRKRLHKFGSLAAICMLAYGAVTGATGASNTSKAQKALLEGELLHTGMRITPTAAPGSEFRKLNPDLAGLPDFVAGQAVSTAVSPDGKTLLILTSGYNRMNAADGRRVADWSMEYVFVYDVSGKDPVKKQVLKVPNTFNGLAWNPNGQEFYVSGGVNNNVHIYAKSTNDWTEVATVDLGSHPSTGYYQPMAAGLGVNSAGDLLVAANMLYDSVTVVDLKTRSRIAEVDLRPGVADPAKAGTPGGTYPFWVTIKGEDKAYISSQRDREIVIVDLKPFPRVVGRIPAGGLPGKMILNASQKLLFVAQANSDAVAVVDTETDRVLAQIGTTAPANFAVRARTFKGSNPNSVALSPDEQTLYVTNGGTNSLAVIELSYPAGKVQGRVAGLIPTGYYPNSVSISTDGSMLYAANGKSNTGPNPKACRDTTSIAPGATTNCASANQYSWQLTKAGFLTMPVPSRSDLVHLTQQVAYNCRLNVSEEEAKNERIMSAVRSKIKHVIYVVKENRTYDQVFGDLPRGNGDPNLAIMSPYSPNHKKLAMNFVLLDNFHDSGTVSGDGWNWSTAGRTTDYTEKTVAVRYGGRGFSYDWEGANRNVNVALPDLTQRQTQNPSYPNDPNLLPGTRDVAAPDSPSGEAGTGYLWDSALRAGLTIRNYGFFVANGPWNPEAVKSPFAVGAIQAYPLKQALAPHTDQYFRGYDQRNADYWLYREWEREFDQYAANGNLPNLMFVRFPHDHFGSFSTAISGVNTVETQMADNDYAVGLLIEKVAKSRYKDSTLIFVVEDDAQNGGDHMDAHRSIALVAGPFVKQRALVSRHYTTVSMIRTIADVLGVEPLGLNDALAEPMAEIFHPYATDWSYEAVVPDVLYATQLPLPRKVSERRQIPGGIMPAATPQRSSEYWERVMAGQDFGREDNLDTERFNRALWHGLRGDDVPSPVIRHGKNLRVNRERLLKQYRQQRPPRARQLGD